MIFLPKSVIVHIRVGGFSLAVWRQKAIVAFPMLRRDIQDREYTYYLLFFDLLRMARTAHQENNTTLLTSIYLFAAWCLQQRRAGDLYNAVCVAFYEHLFDTRDLWEAVIPWLTPEVVQNCWFLWEARLSAEEQLDLRQRLDQRKECL